MKAVLSRFFPARGRRRSNSERFRRSKSERLREVSCRFVGGGADAGEAVDASAAEPVAGAFEGEHVVVVDDPVDHRRHNGLVAEDPGSAARSPYVDRAPTHIRSFAVHAYR